VSGEPIIPRVVEMTA